MMCAIAFVPTDDVIASFDTVRDELPDEFLPVANHFKVRLIMR